MGRITYAAAGTAAGRGNAPRPHRLRILHGRNGVVARRVRTDTYPYDTDHREHVYRHGGRRGRLRLSTGGQLASGNIRVCRNGPHRQSSLQNPLHVRRTTKVSNHFPGRRGGGTKLAAQHSQSPYSMFMNLAGLKIILPSTPYDMKGL